jgi:hypothetical protein
MKGQKDDDIYYTTRFGIWLMLVFLIVVACGQIKRTEPRPAIHEPAIVEAKELPEPTPTPTPILSQKEQIIQEINQVFGDDAERGIKMLEECENKTLNPEAINWNRNGTWDFGLWQVNQIHGYSKEQLKDFRFNTKVAYKIFKNAGYSFSPWTCARYAGDKPFWK